MAIFLTAHWSWVRCVRRVFLGGGGDSTTFSQAGRIGVVCGIIGPVWRMLCQASVTFLYLLHLMA